MHVKTSQPSSKEGRIAAHLEYIMSGIVDAINARNFDPDTFPWTSMVNDFKMIGAGAACVANGKTDYINRFKAFSEAHPSANTKILSMETQVYTASGYAEVYVNAHSTGGPDIPLELLARSVGVHEFRRMEGGKWMTVGQTTILGIGDGVVG